MRIAGSEMKRPEVEIGGIANIALHKCLRTLSLRQKTSVLSLSAQPMLPLNQVGSGANMSSMQTVSSCSTWVTLPIAIHAAIQSVKSTISSSLNAAWKRNQ